ncbi:MAG: carbonic anhydrase family protein [Holophagae bacterium]
MKGLSVAATALLLASVGVGCAPAETPAPKVEASPELSSDVVTGEEQQAMTPDMVLADLKAGNERFVAGELTPRDYLAQASATASGQYPKAVVLSCLDSRVPPEIIFDQGIGDIFVGRIAGNFEDVGMLGSFEFATKAAGSKLIVVLGHTSCGAVKGAANDVELGNLTAMLDNFDAAIAAAREGTEGADDASNAELVNMAIELNVRQTMADILENSPVIAEMVANGEVGIAGGIYDLASGRVTWLDS